MDEPVELLLPLSKRAPSGELCPVEGDDRIHDDHLYVVLFDVLSEAPRDKLQVCRVVDLAEEDVLEYLHRIEPALFRDLFHALGTERPLRVDEYHRASQT